MNKNLITGIILLFLISFALGVEVGTIISNAQFNAIDFSTRDLEISIIDKDKTSDSLILSINYKTLEKRSETNDWIVIQNNANFAFPLEAYAECRQQVENNSISECKLEIKKNLIMQVKSLRKNERDYLTSQQVIPFSDEISVDDLTIRDEELND